MRMGGFRNLAVGGGGGPAQGQGGGMFRQGLATSEEDFGKAFDPRVLARLWRYASPYKARIAVGVFLLLLNTGATILNPLLPGLAVNQINDQSEAGLVVVSLLFLANNTILWLAQWQQTYQMTWVGQHALYRVASDLFEHIASLPLKFFDQNETGRVMARMQNDVNVLQQSLSNGMINIFGSVLSLGGILVVLFVLNWELAAIVSLSVPVMAGGLLLWQRKARKSFLAARATISAVNASLQENVSGARVIQSLSRERTNSAAFRDVNEENMQANVRAGMISAMVQPMVDLIAAVTMAVAILVGGRMVLNGDLELGWLVSFALYINRFFDPIREMTQQYTNMQRTTVAAERVFEILDWPNDVDDAPDATDLSDIRGEVDFRNVRFSYLPGLEVLHGLDLRIEPGEHVALVGATGAGKSTIISLVARFYDVDSGGVFIDGHDVRTVTLRSLRRNMGIVLQDPFIFSGTVRDNIAFGKPGATDDEVEAAAKAVGVHDLILRLEKGYQTRIMPGGSNLSLGQRQLINFARAMLVSPRILMLDEATAGIDTQTEAVLQRGVANLMAGRTAVVIAHRLSTIRNSDRIIVLEHGRVAEEGNHQSLMARRGIYYELYTMGFQDNPASSANGHHEGPPVAAAER